MPTLFPFARSGIEGEVTDTWTPGATFGSSTYDSREEEYVGALWPDYDDTDGHRVYRGVKNTSGSALAASIVVATDASATNRDYVELAPASSPKSRCRGVTIGAIANGDCGWVVAWGKVTVTADDTTAVSANTPICVGTGGVAGTVMSATVGTHSEAGFSTAAIATDATGKVFVDMLW